MERDGSFIASANGIVYDKQQVYNGMLGLIERLTGMIPRHGLKI
jgi:hypothetical protein